MLYIVFYLRFFLKNILNLCIMHEQFRQNSIKNQE